MPLAPSTRLGPYEIIAPIGSGGMGEVYKARDTRLDRTVAVKVLPSHISVREDLRARFEREARTISSINHPHICTLYDVGREADVNFLVMEHLEGETLEHRLQRGPLSIQQALQYALQIADALDRAHRIGIIHRDLKPANIMVTRDGVKVLDFGLASRAKQAGSAAAGATLTQALTTEGTVLGTPQYMSPEQVEGAEADARSDIFAFGCVVYEMVTRRRAFDGKTKASVIGAVLTSQPPPMSTVQAVTPRALDNLVGRCLAKDPEDRYQCVRDALLDLRGIVHEPVSSEIRQSKTRSWRAAAALCLVLLAAAAAGGYWAGHSSRAPAQPPFVTPKFMRITNDVGITFEPAISQDGNLVVYASDRAGRGDLDLWLQHTGGKGLPLRLTEAAADEHEPSFSPDGNQIAFRSEQDGGGIYVVAVLGGAPRLLVRGGRGPRWSPDGKYIAYWTGGRLTGAAASNVLIIPSSGGNPVDVSAIKGRNRYPVWSPDGDALFLGAAELGQSDEVWIVDPRGTAAPRKIDGTLRLRPSTAWRGMLMLTSSEGLKALPLSAKPVAPAGPLIDVTPGLAGESTPVASANGSLVFASVNERMNVWSVPVNAAGTSAGPVQQLTRSAGLQLMPALSSDGKKLVYRMDAGGILVVDLNTGKENLIVPPGEDMNLAYPSFSPDGKQIAANRFVRDAKTGKSSYPILVLDAAGGPPELVCEDCGLAPVWSADGRKLVWDFGVPRYLGITDVRTKTSRRLTAAASRGIFQGAISPDGRWVLAEMEHGPERASIVVAAYKEGAEIQPSEWTSLTASGDAVPTGFDSRPRWSPDGNRIYFVSDRDGFRCIWTMPLSAETKRPSGPAAPVAHFHAAQRSIGNISRIAAFNLAVGRDKLVFNLGEVTGNIWMAR